MEKEESFKLNEINYKVACLKCDTEYGFSKQNPVKITTSLKQNLKELIQTMIRQNRTISIDMDQSRKNLFQNLEVTKKKRKKNRVGSFLDTI
jgi:hypothetical protein